jgi:hypothetical protein
LTAPARDLVVILAQTIDELLRHLRHLSREARILSFSAGRALALGEFLNRVGEGCGLDARPIRGDHQAQDGYGVSSGFHFVAISHSS